MVSKETVKRLRDLARKGEKAGISFFILQDHLTDDQILTRYIFAWEAWVEMRIADKEGKRS